MRVSLDALFLQDFKAFRGAHTLDFGSMSPGVHFLRGVNLIDDKLGSNGAGKSSLWDALCWCLYGRTVEGLRNPDVKSWGGPKSTLVTVTFDVDGDPRYVQRRTHPNRLILDGDEVGQDQIDALIGMSHKTFLHTALLGQGQPLFLDLTPGDMLALFSEVLELSRWEERAARASEKVSKIEARKQRLEIEIARDELAIGGMLTQIKELRIAAADWEEGHKAKRRALTKERFEERSARAFAVKELEALELQEDMAATELRLAKSDSDKEYDKLFELRDNMTRLTDNAEQEERALRALKLKMKALRKGESKGTSVCPVCQQTVKGKAFDDTLTRLNDELRDLEGSGTVDELSKVRRAYRAHESHIKTVREGVDALESRAKALSAKIVELQTTLKFAEAEKARREKAIQELSEAKNPYDDQIKRWRSKRRDAKADLDEGKALVKKLARRADRAKFWAKGFKDIRLQVLGDVLEELQVTSNAMLAELGLVGWEILFNIERETKTGSVVHGIDVEVNSPRHKEPVKWRSWSGGERQRLRMIVSLALSEILLRHAGLQTNFVILDEPTQHLSDSGISDLCELLAEHARDHERVVFYTDHHTAQSSLFSSVLTVERTDKGSRIIET